MRPHHSDIYQSNPSIVSSVIVAALSQTAQGRPVNLREIVRLSRVSFGHAQNILAQLTGREEVEGIILGPSTRFEITIEAVKLGASERALKALTWQEFEQFSCKCLAEAGFEVRKGVVFSDSERRWQIDLVAMKSDTLLSIDCKHWRTAYYPSKFNGAIEHQKRSIKPLIQYLTEDGTLSDRKVWVLSMIMTLFRPRDMMVDGVVFISPCQLSDFVYRLTPYDPELPFVLDPVQAESSISRDLSQ